MNSTPPDSGDNGFPESPRQDSNWPPRSTPPDNEGLAWEGDGPFFQRLASTVAQMMTRPIKTLTPVPNKIVNMRANPLRFAFAMLFFRIAIAVLFKEPPHTIRLSYYLIIDLILPLLIVAVVFYIIIHIETLIVYLGLSIMRVDNKRFTKTFRVICYSKASYVLTITPYAGPFLSFFYSFVIIACGSLAIYRAKERKITGRVLIATALIPFLAYATLITAYVLLSSQYGSNFDNHEIIRPLDRGEIFPYR